MSASATQGGHNETRSTGAVHTSAKARLIPGSIRDPDRHQNLTICSLAHCQAFLKISCKSVQKFVCNVADRQTNNDDYISSLAESKQLSLVNPRTAGYNDKICFSGIKLYD